MLENRGSLATGKAGAGSSVMADVLNGEWLAEARESGEDVSRAGGEANIIADAFSFRRHWILRDLLNHILSSLTVPRHVVVPERVTAIQ